MIQEFIDLTVELFPSISPYTAERAKQAVRQFEREGGTFNCTLPASFEVLTQGDIVDKLPFIIYNEDGTQRSYKTRGLMLSNTCDAENDSTVVFASLLPINELNLDPATIRRNKYYRLLFFPDSNLIDYVVDLSIINSFSKDLIVNSLRENRINKLFSLDTFGWYLLITKLTVHFMRPENDVIQNRRDTQN